MSTDVSVEHIAPKYPESNSEPRKILARYKRQFGLLFDPEDGGNMFFRNISCIVSGYTDICLRRYNSSWMNLVYIRTY
jgi:hypothetical protein